MQENPFCTDGFLIQTRQTLENKSIASGAVGTWTATPDTVSGYTPIAVTGYETNLSSAPHNVVQVRINGVGAIEFSIRNNSGGSISTAPRLTLLYMRT